MSDAGIGTRATEAMGLLIEAVNQIPSQAWDQPSNLERWTIRLASPICGLDSGRPNRYPRMRRPLPS